MLGVTETLWNWIVTAGAVLVMVAILVTNALLNRHERSGGGTSTASSADIARRHPKAA